MVRSRALLGVRVRRAAPQREAPEARRGRGGQRPRGAVLREARPSRPGKVRETQLSAFLKHRGYSRFRNRRTPRGRVARREKNWVHSNCVARRENIFSRTPQVGGVVFLAATGSARFSRRATRATNFKGVENVFRVARRLILFLLKGTGKSFSRRASRKTFFAYPSKSGVENLIVFGKWPCEIVASRDVCCGT